MIELTNDQRAVLAAIPRGRKNALTADQIQIAGHCERERRTQYPTRRIVRELIFLGFPICSSPRAGFWRPTCAADFDESIAQLRSRRVKIAQRERELRKARAEFIRREHGVSQGELFCPDERIGWEAEE